MLEGRRYERRFFALLDCSSTGALIFSVDDSQTPKHQVIVAEAKDSRPGKRRKLWLTESTLAEAEQWPLGDCRLC